MGYLRWRQDGRDVVAAREVSAAVRVALRSALSLSAWARENGERSASPAGRGTLHVAPLGDRQAAVRHALRGGWMRPLGDRYFDRRPRPFVELAVSDRLRAAGVATPEVLAALVMPARFGYRSDLATEWLEPGHGLFALLTPNVYPVDVRRAGLAAAGHEVGRAHAVGLDHPDLNVGNLFLQPTAEGSWTASLLDLDRATIGNAFEGAARRNLERFVRSMEKERRGGRIAWDRADLETFFQAHAAASGHLSGDA
ncbi:MAG: lipopolysaccharide kinase InaA family protein [Gemmatimonadota bacterium]